MTFYLVIIFTVINVDHVVADGYPTRDEIKAKAEKIFGEPKNATRLVPDGRVWVDAKRGLVIVDGFVTLRQGQLEMFACPAGTKEHEAIVALFTASRHVHAALLAAGANEGDPTQFEPYRPASGATIQVSVLWIDTENKKHLATAQSWIRDARLKKEMPYDWVFAGSGFYKDIDTGEERYLGDSGDLICVANFPTATLDLAIESAAANSALTFEAFTDRIPPLFTPVRVVLKVTDTEPRRSSDPPVKVNESKLKEKMSEEKEFLEGLIENADAKSLVPESEKPEAKNSKTK